MYRVRFGRIWGIGGTTDRVEKQVNRMGETGSRGKEGRDDARWEDDLLLVGYIHFFLLFPVSVGACCKQLGVLGRIG